MAIKTVKTKYGTVEGVAQRGCDYTVFRGVPFAKPPVGERRFAAPADPDCWEGVKVCDTFAPAPIQGGRPGEKNQNISEDCLYLNIFTPAESAGENLPVMVWIFGGGFQGGSASNPEFDGKAINGQGVILVTINYRLGVLGFFANTQIGSMNLGLLDQQAALKWIKENISEFGGDPENVTIFGQSAGGMSCRMQITSPAAKGLFQKAIVESGGGLNEADPVKTAEEFKGMCDKCLDYLGWTAEDIMTKDAEEVISEMNRAAKATVGKFQVGYFQPFIDGYTIVDVPGKLIKEGKTNDIQVMVGTVAGDSWMFSSSVKDDLADNLSYFKGCAIAPQMSWAKTQIEEGRAPIYTFYMDRAQPPRKPMGGGGMTHGGPPFGAQTPHSSEIAYVFGTLEVKEPGLAEPFSDYDRELSTVMTKYWTNFAKTGDPNGEGLPLWPKAEGDMPLSMHFGDDGYGAENIITSDDEMKIIRYTMLHPGLLTSVEGLENL